MSTIDYSNRQKDDNSIVNTFYVTYLRIGTSNYVLGASNFTTIRNDLARFEDNGKHSEVIIKIWHNRFTYSVKCYYISRLERGGRVAFGGREWWRWAVDRAPPVTHFRRPWPCRRHSRRVLPPPRPPRATLQTYKWQYYVDSTNYLLGDFLLKKEVFVSPNFGIDSKYELAQK